MPLGYPFNTCRAPYPQVGPTWVSLNIRDYKRIFKGIWVGFLLGFQLEDELLSIELKTIKENFLKQN